MIFRTLVQLVGMGKKILLRFLAPEAVMSFAYAVEFVEHGGAYLAEICNGDKRHCDLRIYHLFASGDVRQVEGGIYDGVQDEG